MIGSGVLVSIDQRTETATKRHPIVNGYATKCSPRMLHIYPF
jgi:hypothetical protein